MRQRSRRPGEGSGSERSLVENSRSLSPSASEAQLLRGKRHALDVIHDFIAFMHENGVRPLEPVADRLATGTLIRFRCEGDRKGRLNGWAVLHLDGCPAGAFGNFRADTGVLKWRSGTYQPMLSPTDRAALRRKSHEARKRYQANRCAANEQAARQAAAMWQAAHLASEEHPYVARKQIDPFRLRQVGQELLIGMFGEDGRMWNLQRVGPNGRKHFLRGGRVDGLFNVVGTITPLTRQAVITEGYATADAVCRASGLPAIAAFSAQNLATVARLWKAYRPDLEYIIFGDDDRATEARTGRNPGRQAANAAALQIGAKVTFAHVKE